MVSRRRVGSSPGELLLGPSGPGSWASTAGTSRRLTKSQLLPNGKPLLLLRLSSPSGLSVVLLQGRSVRASDRSVSLVDGTDGAGACRTAGPWQVSRPTGHLYECSRPRGR